GAGVEGDRIADPAELVLRMGLVAGEVRWRREAECVEGTDAVEVERGGVKSLVDERVQVRGNGGDRNVGSAVGGAFDLERGFIGGTILPGEDHPAAEEVEAIVGAGSESRWGPRRGGRHDRAGAGYVRPIGGAEGVGGPGAVEVG